MLVIHVLWWGWVNGSLALLWPKDWTHKAIPPYVNLPLIGKYWWMIVWLRIIFLGVDPVSLCWLSKLFPIPSCSHFFSIQSGRFSILIANQSVLICQFVTSIQTVPFGTQLSINPMFCLQRFVDKSDYLTELMHHNINHFVGFFESTKDTFPECQ